MHPLNERLFYQNMAPGDTNGVPLHLTWHLYRMTATMGNVDAKYVEGYRGMSITTITKGKPWC